jgi:hypothetical protein
VKHTSSLLVMDVSSRILRGCDAVWCCVHLQDEDGGSMDLRNVSVLPERYTASQPGRP